MIPPRENPDQIKNAHADSFISYLKDNRSLILNGRITPQYNNYTFVSPRGCSVPDYLFTPVDHLGFCREMKTLLVSDVVNTFRIQPPNSLPDHSILRGIFVTSFYENNAKQNFPQNFPKYIPPKTEPPCNRPKKKNLKKMPNNFFMTEEINDQIIQTINRIDTVQSTQQEINRLWTEIKTLFCKQLDELPNIPTSSNKKQNKLFRKSQPFWNPELSELWKITCQAEKDFTSFKVKNNYDLQQKRFLRDSFKRAQKIFDSKFRELKRKYKKQKDHELERSAKLNPTDMWSSLKKLSNPPSSRAALEIVREDETISKDIKEVLERWLKDISNLFSGVRENPEMVFDENFYQEVIDKRKEFENLSSDEQQQASDYNPEELNTKLSFDEVSSAIDKTKLHKAYLEIPNEALKNFNAKCVLHQFFNLCFKSGLNPADWDFSDIKPIPKKDKDPRDPLQNRCITIMCCVAKVYSKILNARIQKYLEKNNILVEEQNGFRAGRSCIDHLFVLCTVLRNRKLSGEETFLCFIDYKKAFDSVERNLLLYKLSQVGITGHMYRAISSLYSNPKSRVILNDHETEYFDCPVGVKQGDCLSPTLFAIFINDLAIEIKNSNIGIQLDENLNILLYADDIVLLAENESDLQFLLTMVEKWCKKWRLEINLTKTNIMHIRPNRKKQSMYKFLFDLQPVPYCSSYKYLGANIDEFLDYSFTANILADSAGRALSSVITKMIKNGGFPYNVYTILYDACVTSIADYAGEITGFTQYQSSLKVHLRAIRAFLGLPKNSCNPGVLSEVDWLLPEYRTQIKMIRQYSRIVKMDDNRLTKKVLLWDRSLNENNVVSSWSNEVKSIFYNSSLHSTYDTGHPFPLKRVLDAIKQNFKSDQEQFLRNECEQMPKLRTFNSFKKFNELPPYIAKPLTFLQRKSLAKIRLGSLELRIESGRFCRPRLEIHERTCQVCESETESPPVETEFHFMFLCNRYVQLRNVWMTKLKLPDNFIDLLDQEKFDIVFNEPDNVKPTAKFIVDAYSMRSKIIFKL